MKVIKQTPFIQSMLVSTTATEPAAAYSSGTTYALNAVVNYQTRRYQSLQASNTNHTPDTSPTWWLDIGPDNRYAAFDRQTSKATTAITTLTFTVATGTIDSLAFINLAANLITVTVRDGLGGPIIWQTTSGLSGATVYDWYQYFFYDPLLKRTQLVFFGIPPYANSHVTVEISTSTGDTLSLGEMIFGALNVIGTSQYGATAGIIDYSRKTTDEFGNTEFVERAFSKRLNAQVWVPNTELNRVQQLLYSLRASPAVWIASDDPAFEEALVVYGFYKDFSTEIAYPQTSICSIEIEGLT